MTFFHRTTAERGRLDVLRRKKEEMSTGTSFSEPFRYTLGAEEKSGKGIGNTAEARHLRASCHYIT